MKRKDLLTFHLSNHIINKQRIIKDLKDIKEINKRLKVVETIYDKYILA